MQDPWWWLATRSSEVEVVGNVTLVSVTSIDASSHTCSPSRHNCLMRTSLKSNATSQGPSLSFVPLTSATMCGRSLLSTRKAVAGTRQRTVIEAISSYLSLKDRRFSEHNTCLLVSELGRDKSRWP